MPKWTKGRLSSTISIIMKWNYDRTVIIPIFFCAGIKEKYVVQKYGVPLKQLHSYDYSGPYAGFQGPLTFIAKSIAWSNTRVWGLVTPPWKGAPELTATYGWD